MTLQKLRETLDNHIKWLNGEDGGECANLCGANLHGADLSGADLYYADLHGVDLSGADLSGANLRGANLVGVDLCRANLHNTNLSYANLNGADLNGADLSGAKLSGADLSYADLTDANLSGADLLRANLRYADLKGAVYTGTVLNLQCPEEGSFIAWKKLKGDSIAKLLIPEDAKRSSGTTRKCRASKAEVLAIYDEDGAEINEGRSWRKDTFIYRVGETVYPDKWDDDRWSECSNGIHFFMTRKEAEEYY